MPVEDRHGQRQDFLHFEHFIDEVALFAGMRDVLPHGGDIEPWIVALQPQLVCLVDAFDLVILEATQQGNRAAAYVQGPVPADVRNEGLDRVRAFGARRADAVEA
ncbi:hypothetical protein D9M69_657740 [compost metagenome]